MRRRKQRVPDRGWSISTSKGATSPKTTCSAFESDGSISLYGPPVLPALPGEGEMPLFASSGVGTWEAMTDGSCAFEVVRVLAGDDGVGVGTLDVRATVTLDRAAGTLDGQFSYARSTGFGLTTTTGSGTLTGTPIDGPLLWLTPVSGTPSAEG